MGGFAGIRLDYTRGPGRPALDDVGHERDPSFAGNDLTRNADRDGRAAQLLGRAGAASTIASSTATPVRAQAVIPPPGFRSAACSPSRSTLHGEFGGTLCPRVALTAHKTNDRPDEPGPLPPGATAGHYFEIEMVNEIGGVRHHGLRRLFPRARLVAIISCMSDADLSRPG